jgi:hypothetical protein
MNFPRIGARERLYAPIDGDEERVDVWSGEKHDFIGKNLWDASDGGGDD